MATVGQVGRGRSAPSVRHSSSTGAGASRYRYRCDGETTKGGLATISSKCVVRDRFEAGRRRVPRRSTRRSAPWSTCERDRPRVEVGRDDTRSLCDDAYSACTPQPEPRSNAARIGRRIVAPASAIVDALDAQHVVGGDRATARRRQVVGHHPDARVHRAVAARSATRPRRRRPRRHRRSRRASTGTGASAACAAASGTGVPITNSRSKVSSGVAGARRPFQRCELTGAQMRERVGPETIRQRVEREAGVVEHRAEPRDRLGTVEEAHRVHRAPCSVPRRRTHTPTCVAYDLAPSGGTR